MLRLAPLLAAAVALGAPATARAVADCPPGLPETRVLVSGAGTLESVIVHPDGRLFYTDAGPQALMRLDRPGAEPVVAARIGEPLGGLAVDGDGTILLGVGNSLVGGATGNLVPQARIVRVHPDGGVVGVHASGLQMANGLARLPDGTVFASNDIGLGIDRVEPSGKVQVRWASVPSPNGLAIDAAGRWLYAAQTFQPAAIARINIADPDIVETFARPGIEDIAAGPDGMTIDADDRLLVTANLPGEVWRIDRDGSICAVARGIANASAVAVGAGERGFDPRNAYAVGFGGDVVEIPGVVAAAVPPAAGRPQLAPVRLRPASVRVRDGRVRFTPRLTDGTRRVARRIRLRIDGRTRVVRTGRPVSLRVGGHVDRIAYEFTLRGIRRRGAIRLIRSA